MEKKKCYYQDVSYGKGFGWGKMYHSGLDNPQCCIMAIAFDRTVDGLELKDLMEKGKISYGEFKIIKKIDAGNGTDEDIKIMNLLAERFDVELIKHE